MLEEKTGGGVLREHGDAQPRACFLGVVLGDDFQGEGKRPEAAQEGAGRL